MERPVRQRCSFEQSLRGVLAGGFLLGRMCPSVALAHPRLRNSCLRVPHSLPFPPLCALAAPE